MAVGITLAPLLRLRIEHGYYGDAPVPVRLEPVPEAAAALARAGCRVRTGAGLIEVYASAPVGQTPARPADLPETVLVRLLATDPELAVVTARDWPGADRGGAGTCLYLGPETGADGRIVSAGGQVLPVVPPVGRVRLDGPVAGPDVALQPWSGGPPVWSAPLAAPGRAWIDLNAPDLPEGRYRLVAGDRVLRDLYLSDRPWTQVLGVAEVPLEAAVPVPPGRDPTTLVLAFAACAPRWRYVIHCLDADRDLSGARIDSGDAGPGFSPPVRAVRAGRPVWIITSDGPLPLRRDPRAGPRPSLGFAAGSQPAPPPVGLPVAAPDATRLEAGAEGAAPALWSTLHVTV